MKPAFRYAFAVVATLVAWSLTWVLPGLLAPMRLFFFWGAVLVTAVVAGLGPAAVAIALSLAGAMSMIAPTGEFSRVDALRLSMFTVFCGGISLAVGLRRRAEHRAATLADEVRLNELRYRTLVEATPVQQAVFTATPEGRVHWPDSWLEITGLTRADVEGTGGLRVVHPDDTMRTWDRWQHALATASLYEDEIRIRLKDGGWRWFTVRAVPVMVEGRVAEWTGIIADVDERKRHEQQSEFLNRASELLSSSLEYDKTLRTLARLCVPALGDWCAIHLATGESTYERVAVEHSDPAKVHYVEQLDRRTRPSPDMDPIVQVMRSGRSHIVEYVTDEMLVALVPTAEQLAAIRTMGFRSWIVAPMITGGQVLGTLTVVHGESGRRYSEADLPFIEDLARRAATAIENARLFEAADAANRAKDEFLATLSHELRTPLTAITGWAHMLQAGVAEEETRKLAVDTIVRSARTQAELIDDLLDLSRVVAGTLHLNITTVDLASIVQDVLATVKPAVDAKGLSIAFDEASPALVRGDERRLRQIVWNLVTNAVKFTESGGSIRIVLSLQGQNARLEVIDTGRGIEASFLPHVWDRFRQADSSTVRQFGGLGLGLAVVRNLVELHGGTVTVESAGVNQGARFGVEIPLARLDAAASSALRADVTHDMPLAGHKILVVDDDTDSRTVITAMLRHEGAEVTPVATVEAALAQLKETAFAVVVSDLAMPGEDGYALARRIRATSSVPMVAVSALASGTGDRQRAIERGFDDFLRKPVDPGRLAEVVRAAIRSS